MSQIVSSAAVVIGALRVRYNITHYNYKHCIFHQIVIAPIHVNLVLIVWATIKDSGVLPSGNWVNTCEFGTDRLGNHQKFRCATK